jgi:CHAD domain-containing protein
VYFTLHHAAAPEAWLAPMLPAGWRLNAAAVSNEQREFYDTFSWQAFEKKLVIVKKQRTLVLIDLESGKEIDALPFPKTQTSFFAETLPISTFKEKLCECSAIRAFAKRCVFTARSQAFYLLDEREKRVATVSAESLWLAGHASDEALIHLLIFSPLRGYEAELAPMMQAISHHGEVATLVEFKDLFLQLMRQAGCNVQGYSAKIKLTLNPDAPIHHSAREFLQATLLVMRHNEEGIKTDGDSEFLHDYRVAVRRTRSIIKQLKGVFEANETAYFLKLFRAIGKRSNELRDKDVALLREEQYRALLPPSLRQALPPFFRDIAASRKPLHRRLCGYLSSNAYHASLQEWENFLREQTIGESETAPNALRSTRSVALESIKKAWKKVLRHGRQISAETTDAELHALRIDCKKLRYLLEFFAPMFDGETITPVIRQVKALQENLGDVVDFAVQLCFLGEQLAEMPADKPLAASLGGLTAILFRQQEEARLQFHKTFERFDQRENWQLFNKLLTGT